MAKVLIVQHAECEKPGLILQELAARQLEPVSTHGYEGRAVPREMGDAAGLVIMGGPMGVYDSGGYPFLADEMRLIEDALRQQKPILGVCLGSQLLAAALGAAVTRGRQKEIGWFPVKLTEMAQADTLWRGVSRTFTALHWHGDIFELPRGAESLASSALTERQAFRYGLNAYGILFHIEATVETLRGMTEAFPQELAEAGTSGERILEQSRLHLPPLAEIARTVFSRWAHWLA